MSPFDALQWVIKGKTDDISDILGMSPRTVNKHLEHIGRRPECRAAKMSDRLPFRLRVGVGNPLRDASGESFHFGHQLRYKRASFVTQ